MYSTITEYHNNKTIKIHRFMCDDLQLTFYEVLKLWQENDEFNDFYTSVLHDCGFGSFVWEHPLLSAELLHQAYEFVLIRTPNYFNQPDTATFKDYFVPVSDNQGIVSFPNLGHDAYLIVPSPIHGGSNYSSLADFVRSAPLEQTRALWQVTGREVMRRIPDQTVWLSVAGGGVAWLHIRLDSRPKYYRYGPYRSL